MKYKIYLDDVRTPKDPEWILVKNYDEFVQKIQEIGLSNISTISLDHDLGDTAMTEYFNNVAPNYKLNYDNITEKTGLDCAKWLIEHYFETSKDKEGGFTFPLVYSHSANPIGRNNIIGYIENFYKNFKIKRRCEYVIIPFTIVNSK